MISNSKKAAPKRAAFFLLISLTLLLSLPGVAKEDSPVPRKTSETYKDLIEKAQNLVLQKDRQQAILILTSGLQNEKVGTRGFKEIKKFLGEASRVFLIDKTQQLYELSLSLKKTDSGQAQQRLADASRLEPDNITLILEQARQSLAKNDCRAADDGLTKTQKLIPYDDEIVLAHAQAAICSNELAGYAKLRDQSGVGANNLFWFLLEVERQFKEKNYVKAREALSGLKKIDKNYPEIHYWAWRLDFEQKIPSVVSPEKYLAACQNLSSTQQRRFSQDPWLCRRTSELEQFIKSQPQGVL